jgi:hypothetical protein
MVSKAAVAYMRASRYLADGNEFSDEAYASKDEQKRAERYFKKAASAYVKAQFWLDRFNKLTGQS